MASGGGNSEARKGKSQRVGDREGVWASSTGNWLPSSSGREQQKEWGRELGMEATSPTRAAVWAIFRTAGGRRGGRGGRQIGPDTSQIWTWANYKICSSLDAL
jgi:hypothetical protein